MSAPRNPAIDAFIEKAINYEDDKCLLWPFSLDDKGYARVGSKYISRIVCAKVYGLPPTPEHEAAHSKKCISTACINRRHLRWATRLQNMADNRRGEDHTRTKLTNDQVLEIKKLAGTMSQRTIAKCYNISKDVIWNIIHHRNWKWLEGPCDAELLFATTRPKMQNLFA
jgi:hypothetical protein